MSKEKSIVKEYKDDTITVVWKPQICIHSEKCFHGLPEVFDPNAKPWVNMEGAASDRIAEQVKHCPSGALSFYHNDEPAKRSDDQVAESTKVEVIPNGPLMVHGTLSVKDTAGNKSTKERLTAFCRCGASSNKPYCDGSHKKINFEGL